VEVEWQSKIGKEQKKPPRKKERLLEKARVAVPAK